MDKQGFDDGVFLIAGSLQPNAGTIMAHNATLSELRERVTATRSLPKMW